MLKHKGFLMEIHRVPNNELSSEPTAETAATSNNVTPNSQAGASLPAPPPKSRKIPYLALVILLIVGVCAASYLWLRPAKKQTIGGKSDIPILSTAEVGGGNIPQYPISYANDATDVLVESQLFEGLVGYKNQNQIVPLLAAGWTNPDDTTWVFNLRHNVKFRSGRILTATDVKYSLDYAVAHQDANGPNSAFSAFAHNINAVKVINPYRISVTTSGPDATLLAELGPIGIVDSRAKLGDYNAGTGPYKVKIGTTPSSSKIDLVANDDYWQGHVYAREVKISAYDDKSKFLADAADGKFDYSGPYSQKELTKLNAYKLISLPDQGLTYLGINTNNAASPLHSLAARQAVAYAMNIPQIIKAGSIVATQTNQLVPTSLPGYDPSIQTVKYNPAKAKELLDSAPNHNAPIVFATGAESPQDDEMVNELKAVGFNVRLAAISDFGSFVNDAYAGKYDIFTLIDTSATVDGLPLLSDQLINTQYYDNPKVDQLIKQASSTINTSQRINYMQQVAQIVDTDKPIIPLFTQDQLYALIKPSYVINTDLPDLGGSSYFWKDYQK